METICKCEKLKLHTDIPISTTESLDYMNVVLGEMTKSTKDYDQDQDQSFRAFLRPSGTEHALRLYVEGPIEEMVKLTTLRNDLMSHIWKRYGRQMVVIRGETFTFRHLQASDLDKDVSSFYDVLSELSSLEKDKVTKNDSLFILKQLQKQYYIFVVEHKDRIVGSGSLFIEQKFFRTYGKVGHIEDIVVTNKCRGYGLGKRIIDFLTNLARDLECYKTILNCNDKNVAFYEKCGYAKKENQMVLYMKSSL